MIQSSTRTATRFTLALLLGLVFGHLSLPAAAAEDLQPRPAREPLFVTVRVDARDLLYGTRDRFDRLADHAVARVSRARAADPAALVVLEIKGAPLAWSDPSLEPLFAAVDAERRDAAGTRYERNLAAFLQGCMDRARRANPGVGLAVEGLPLERSAAGSRRVSEANANYARVIDEVDAFVTGKSLIFSGSASNELDALRRGLAQTFKHRGDRPLMYRSNGQWRIAYEAAPAADSRPTGATAGRSDRTHGGSPRTTGDVNVSASTGSALAFGGGGAGLLGGGGIAPSARAQRALDAGGASRGAGGSRRAGVTPTFGWRGDDQAFDWTPADGPSIEDPDLTPPGGGGGGGGWNPPGGGELPGHEPGWGPPGGGEDPFEEDGPYLQPGPGWNGPTPQPGPIGDPGDQGFNAKVIARWDVVPFQTLSEEFNVGIVAFHRNGIDRVEFAVDGGPWVPVAEMRLNPRTAVWEYFATVRPSDFDEEGPIELRARIFPAEAGVPRVLQGELKSGLGNGEHSLVLNVNGQGTLPTRIVWCSPQGSDENGDGTALNPFRNPARALQHVTQVHGSADGTVCYLKPGGYTWGPAPWPTIVTERRWATVQAAPGADRTQVFFNETGDGGFKTSLVRVKDVTIDKTFLATASVEPRYLWVDGCRIVGRGRTNDFQTFHASNWTGVYVTDTSIESISSACEGVALARRVLTTDLGSDAFSMSRLVVSCEVQGIDASGTDFHPDVYQFKGAGSVENHIVYSLKALDAGAQGIFADDLQRVDNAAFVNVLIEGLTGLKSQWKDVETNHLLLWNVAVVGQPFTWRTSLLENVSIVGGIWQKMENTSNVPLSSQVMQNHFIDADSFGAGTLGFGVTTGDPGFTDPAGNDFTPLPWSPTVGRISDPSVPVDLDGNSVDEPATVGPIYVEDPQGL